MNINILVLEDEKIINDFIVSSLIGYQKVKGVLNVDDAIKELELNQYHIILSDILMDGKDGFDLLKYIDEKNLKIPVIVLSALSDDSNIQKAYDLGAIDYITKPINKNLLQKKIKVLVEYLYKVKDDILLNESSETLILNGEEILLTKKEYEIFKLLYKNSPRIYTKENILDIIWNGNYEMSHKIIEVNIFSIRKKLSNYSTRIKTKRGIGYYYED